MGLTDYPKLIKEPMDLGTVAERVGKLYYLRLEQFANDVRLVWVRFFCPCNCTAPPCHHLRASLNDTPDSEKCLHLQRARLALLQGRQDALRRL